MLFDPVGPKNYLLVYSGTTNSGGGGEGVALVAQVQGKYSITGGECLSDNADSGCRISLTLALVLSLIEIPLLFF